MQMPALPPVGKRACTSESRRAVSRLSAGDTVCPFVSLQPWLVGLQR